MIMKKRIFCSILLLSALSLVLSCRSTKKIGRTREGDITLAFAGDVMAHSNNFRPGNFDRIWHDVSPLLHSVDLAFANIEAPVADGIEWSSYPKFNMHSEYVEAAIKAGFSVFSLANNHTNDQSIEGIRQTRNYFANRPGIWACGLKENQNDGITYKLIEKKAADGSDWKILFVAITELLNNNAANSEWIDYYPSTVSSRKKIKAELKKLANDNPHDIFIASIHTDDPEYVLEITEDHKNFFTELVKDCNVDIVWANHPHVTKPWEKIPTNMLSKNDGFIMYANGNTISGQRTNPSFSAPDTPRDYTGDGVIIKLRLHRELHEIQRVISQAGENEQSDFEESETVIVERTLVASCEPHFITAYISPSNQYLVKSLDNSFIQALDRSEISDWPKYLIERKKIMERLLNK